MCEYVCLGIYIPKSVSIYVSIYVLVYMSVSP